MANRRVTLVLNAKTEKGWRRLPVVIGENGRARPGYGRVDGKPVQFEQFRYELRRYEGKRMVYAPAGEDAAEAYSKQKQQQKKRTATADAKSDGVQVVEQTHHGLLRDDVGRFIQRTRDAGSLEAAQTYGQALEDFLEAVSIHRADEIDPDLMLRYHAALREKGNGDRTIANKHAAVKAFILWLGMDKKILGRPPRYEKKMPKVYNRDVVSSLIAANDDELLAITLDVLRMVGLREQEAVYLQWPDIDFHRGVIKVRSKLDHGFQIKDSEERDVAMPADLAKRLKAWQRKRPNSTWVLGTAGDKPQLHMLRSLKRLAYRAGLNCGRCKGCQSKHHECREFTLHSFRRSYATTLDQNGVGTRTIMEQLGHADLATTLRYLSAAKVTETKKLVDKIAW
jgi:integrase